MTIDVRILSVHDGDVHQVGATHEGALLVNQLPFPPNDEDRREIFISDMKNSAGSFDMQVVGSLAAPFDFFVESDPEHDVYITQLAFTIVDAGSTANKFGNIAALSNGCKLFYFNGESEVTIRDSLKSNYDFLRLCLFNPSVGSGSDAFKLTNVVSTSEAYIAVLDFFKVMPPFGLKLQRGSKQRLSLRVQDNTTGVDGFEAVAYGFKRLRDKD